MKWQDCKSCKSVGESEIGMNIRDLQTNGFVIRYERVY